MSSISVAILSSLGHNYQLIPHNSQQPTLNMHRILFLCMGNICRSPAAHCFFQHLVDETGLSEEFEIESAGTIGFHAGGAPDRRMQQVMRSRGIPRQSVVIRHGTLRYYSSHG